MPHLIHALSLLFSLPAAADEIKDTAPVPPSVEARLEPKSGSKVKGIVQLTESSNGLQVRYKLSGLAKNGKHGFHIHEKGDCSSKDAKSAGPHFMKIADGGGTSKDNPDRYAGDMPEISADAKGNAEGTVLLSHGGLNKAQEVVNRAIILHGGPDDINKPSAKRVACGVIEKAKM